MYDYELKLIRETYTQDEYGNLIPAEDEPSVSVLCDLRSITRSEFYSASQAGLNPEIVFEINGFEYGGEKEVEFNGERYSVIRTYRADYEKLELTCEKKVRNGN